MQFPEKASMVQFIKFGIVGLSNTGITLAVYYIFVCISEKLYLAGNIAGWIVSVANAFFWNNKYVFANKEDESQKILKRLGKTYLSYGAVFLLSTGLLYLEVDILHWSAVISPAFNLLITIPLNFLLNKFWTFKGN